MKLFNRKKKEQDENKQPAGQVIKNNLYGLQIIFKTAPILLCSDLFTTVINTLCGFLTGTLMLRQIINNFQNKVSAEETIFMIIVIYLIDLVIGLGNSALFTFVLPVMNTRLKQTINEMMYDKLNQIELACYENKEFYDRYVQVAGDILGRTSAIRETTASFLRIITGFSTNTILLITIEPWLIVFAVIPLFSTFIFGRWDGKYLFEYNMEMAKLERQREYSRRTFYLSDFAKEMRLSRMGTVMLNRFRYATATIIKFMKRKLPFHAFLQFMIGFFSSDLCVYAAMLFAIWRTLVSGTMMYGDCLVVINSVSSVIYYMSNFSKTNADFFSHSLYIENLKEFMAYEPKLQGGELQAPRGSTKLELTDIHFRYDGQETDTLRGVNITIHPREKIALVGHNGAGKTTLAKLMLRLYDPTEGVITYGGKDIREYKLDGGEGYRDRFAVVFQDFKLFSMSVADNILLRKRREGDAELITEAMEQSGVSEKIATLEHGSDTMLTREFDDKGVVLSGGEGQKVAISRAFAKKAEIVILDEPSSALDPVAEYKMYDNMLRACENKSVVFISHRLSSATLADTIYLLEDGKVIEQGSHKELMNLQGKYAEMFRIQAENYITEKAEGKNEEA